MGGGRCQEGYYIGLRSRRTKPPHGSAGWPKFQSGLVRCFSFYGATMRLVVRQTGMSVLHIAMNLLGLEPDDIRKRLNPANVPHLFLGDDSTIQTADVQESLEEVVDTVISRIPARYGAISERVEGEYIVRCAIGGETALTLGLFPASDVRLYINLNVPWDSRRPAESLRDGAGCTVNVSTGGITLETALATDDCVVAEYNHTAMAECHLLRRIAVDLVAAEWARRIYPDDTKFERYLEWERRANYDLARMKGMKDGERMGIRMFDRLDLVNETQEERMVGGGELSSSSDML